MDQTFNVIRWWQLVRLHWAENRKRYWLGMLAIGGLLTAWYSFLLTMDKFSPLDTIFQFSAYFIGIYFIGCLLGSTTFSALSKKQEGIGYLALPASHLEKLACGLLFHVILFFTAFTVIFYIVDIPMVHLAKRLMEESGQGGPIYIPPVYNIFLAKGAPIPERVDHLFLIGYFVIQSAYVLGSVYFRKAAFLKTTVAVLLFGLILTLYATKIEHLLPYPWRMRGLFEWERYHNGANGEARIYIPFWIESSLRTIMQFGLPLIFWTITYFRLKEKEV